MLSKSECKSYRADSIKILKGLEAVKKRPGMYIGDTDDGTGLHHMVYEVLDNSIDEALAGYCKNIKIEVNKDGTLSVLDDGRGIPVDIHKGEKKSAAEVIMTQLHAGGKFDHSSYKVSGGLHGVGVSVVNALSQKLKLTIYRDKKEHYIEFKDGKALSPLKVIGKTNKTGTLINFLPSKEIFSSTTFSSSIIQKRVRELAYLNRGIRISIIDKTGSKTKEFVNKYDGGIDEFVEFLDNKKEKLLNNNENELFKKPISITGKKGDVIVESSIRWNAGYSEEVLAFTNNIFQKDGGTHLLGFRSALTRVINRYAKENSLLKKNKITLSGDDIREGLTAVLSIKMPDPKFSSQTKDKLVSSEIRLIIESIINEKLSTWFDQNPSIIKVILAKVIHAAVARDVAVEGDSAGGSAKQGRNRKFQAVLPLRGKILNTHIDNNGLSKINGNEKDHQTKALSKMMSSNEIVTLINALGVDPKDFEIDDLRYGKIIIMTDADVDGSHIRTLLLTFFNNYPFYKLIENGKIFLAQPPLYRISKGTKNIYIKDDKELESFIIKSSEKSKKINKDSSKYKAFIDNEKSKMSIQRFKGLGEMNPEELWSTTLNPETRTLLKVEYSKQTKIKSKDDQKLIQILMGNDVAPRKNFIISRALDVSNLDI